MPRNFKEALLFTCMMCGMMVFGMSIWNLQVAGAFAWSHVFLGFFPGFIVAFILDMLIIGPLAKKVTFSLIPRDSKSKYVKIFAVSGCMVLGMVTCMSLYSIIFNLGLEGVSLVAYGQAWLTNFVVALPYNFVVVGPIARYFLGGIQKQAVLA